MSCVCLIDLLSSVSLLVWCYGVAGSLCAWLFVFDCVVCVRLCLIVRDCVCACGCL